MEEPTKYKDPSLKDYPILRKYEYVFGELSGFPQKRDIDFSIDLIRRFSLVSETPYVMSTLELNDI
jgi:hypothetical protein